MSTISQQMKEKRKQLGETQAVFGKRFGKSHAAVSEWESGKAEAPYVVISHRVRGIASAARNVNHLELGLLVKHWP